MPLDLPLYYGGVADEDMLDEFLANRRELEHGQSSTMDVRRFLNVRYHQASMGKLKKVAVVATIVILIIMVVTFSFGSPSSRKLEPATYSAPTPPTEKPGFQKGGFVLALNPDIPFDLGLKCHSCALVSSSGMLLDSHAGSQIDSVDCVFRLNTAPVLGYQEDIGQKTTVRVLSLPGLKSLLRDQILTNRDASDYVILLGPGEVLCKNCTVLKVYQELATHLKHTKFVHVTQEAYRIIKDEAKELGIKYGRQDLLPSARIYAVSLMRNVCTQIRLYGIEKGNPCYSPDSVPLFYWDPSSRAHVCSGHMKVKSGLRQINLENKVFTSWAENSDMEFFYPSR